ncbi:RNA polymerase sigma factor, sigma-70 family [Dyadobacter sp. SG02]|uniref:RNA polymerase sigma factor n=1 Tax=Dyadobacter sp. SG02 TaxID=1855291 RepID=UPI0008B39EEE|nr:sigma-70 family RNA polymerase sigma factor [Dyadobacter sp. SG02]SEI55131.1 RNA polymerase sigma factor, sigma-70 family [Dyadobacter sp. SG02]
MSDFTLPDSQLWCLTKDDDQAAYTTLFRKYYPSLLGYAKSLTDQHGLAADCVQETFMEVWLYRRNLAVPDSVRAYLLAGVRRRIARRLERDRIFRHSRGIEGAEFSFQFTPLDAMISDEETRRQVHQLNSLLNQLPARQREALYLRYHQQLDIDEIARLMQINPQSASNLLHRGIKHIREVWVGELHTFALLVCVYF